MTKEENHHGVPSQEPGGKFESNKFITTYTTSKVLSIQVEGLPVEVNLYNIECKAKEKYWVYVK